MRKTFILSFLFISLLSYSAAFAVEVAPRISDREIIESLAELKAGQIALDGKIDKLEQQIIDTNRRIDDLKISTQQQMNDLEESTNKRFDILQWMLGLFISIALTVMVIMGKILWNQQKKLTEIETSLEAQKEEIRFVKTLIEKLQALIEKLLPPRGVL
jgi:peptidoglycan hydrolase CwlO-like protein